MAESLNICVVDDDRDVAEGLAEILELAGHQVRTAFTGQDALRILDEVNCDVAYVNATLPDLSPLETFMAIRKSRPDMKAVMMTGYTIEQLLRQTVREGSVSVLQKPFALDEIAKALEGTKPKGIVLVAEDDPDIGAKISDTLRVQDHRVGVARTPGDALDMAFADECDVLVLDLRLPVVGALEVYLDLEKQDRALPTIIITGCPDRESGPIDLLRDPAVTGVLVKPFDPARLLVALEQVHKTTDAPPAKEPVEESQQPAGHCGRILVIDDDRDLAEGLGDILRDLGHTVKIAFTGSKALEIARRFDAQIALVDIKLGRTSGLELIASLKKLRPGIVNVVITANAGKESVIASLRSGAFDFLNKPMHPQDLFVILDRCFEHIRAQESQTGESGESSPDLVASVSHELRDPLNAVIGFSEILGDEMLGPLGSEQYVHYARGINEAGHHLTTVIDDLIDHKPGAEETPEGDKPQDDPTQAVGPRTTSSDDAPAELAEPAEVEPEPRGPEAFGSQPNEPVPAQGAALGQAPDEPPVGQAEPKPEIPGPSGPAIDARPSHQTWPDQPDAEGAAVEHTVASPGGADDVQREAAPPQPEGTESEAGAWRPADPVEPDPPAPLISGSVWEDDRPIPFEPSQPNGEGAEFAEDPWPTEADQVMAEFGPAEIEQPEPPWPEPSQPHPPYAAPPGSQSTESAPNEPVREGPSAIDAPPAELGTPERTWADPPAEDFKAVPPDTGELHPEHNPAVAPNEAQEEGETDEETLEAQESMHEDQEQEGLVEKVVRLSPFRKVI